MSFLEIIVIALGLSMDAFAVSLYKGLTIDKNVLNKSLLVGFYFGFFQMIMPCIGYFFAFRFSHVITDIDHWVSFFLLLFIGIQFVRDSFSHQDFHIQNSFGFQSMVPLAFATSIDALVVGVTFAFFHVSLLFAITIIGFVTFFLSFFGCLIGKKFGKKYSTRAQLLGGILLFGIGFKILLEHLFLT